MDIQISSNGSVSSAKLGKFILLFNPWLQSKSLSPCSQPSSKQGAKKRDGGRELFTSSGLTRNSFWAVEREKLEIKTSAT
jgi:hypothetical protein